MITCPECKGSGTAETGIGEYPCDACYGGKILSPAEKAADDMLEALRLAEAAMEPSFSATHGPLVKIRAAIAKATAK